MALLFFALLLGTALAQSEEAVEERVRDITRQLRCPTCQALSVKDSQASFSKQIRKKVRRMVQEGQSDEDIKAYFVSRYGEWILMAPSKKGLGLVFWLLPVAGLFLAGGLIGYRLYRNNRQSLKEAPEDAAPALSEKQREMINRDLKMYEEDD